MKKRAGRLLISFILIIFLIGFISAADSCEIIQGDSCDGQIVMGLSASTNAHGELANQENYEDSLCCNFGLGNTECSSTPHPKYGINIPSNKIIGLSSSTNAHAEIPGQENYPEDSNVCYGEVECVNLVTECNEEYPIEMLSLSASTNAHIGDFEDYDTKICCSRMECRIEVGFCSDYIEEECSKDPCGVAENSLPEIACGEGGIVCTCKWDANEISCGPEWEEVEKPLCGDNLIHPELSEDCDGSNFGDITGCIDLGFTGGTLACYPSGHAQECTLDISGCEGGVEEGECGDEEINNFPFETCDTDNLNSKTCTDFGLTGAGLVCYLSGNPKECTFDTTGCELAGGGNPSKIGKCSYDEDTNDDCEDKFLTYSWIATWTWGEDNTGKAPPCEEDYVLDGGTCYYDPNGAKAKCQDGSNTVPCPAQIQLPFFGIHSVIIIVVAIALIYFLMKFKEKVKKKKSKNPKRK